MLCCDVGVVGKQTNLVGGSSSRWLSIVFFYVLCFWWKDDDGRKRRKEGDDEVNLLMTIIEHLSLTFLAGRNFGSFGHLRTLISRNLKI